MSDDTDTGSQEERIARLETGQQTLGEKLDQVLAALSHRPAPKEGDEGAERPDVAEMVRLELERGKKEREAADAAEAEKSDREQIKEQLAKLKEAPPVQPQRRSERVIWGAR